MTITCSEHFKMQRSSLQRKKKSQDGAYFFCSFLSFLLHPSISASCSACTETAQIWFYSSFTTALSPAIEQQISIVTVVTVRSCGEHLQDWNKKKKRASGSESTRKWIKALNHGAASAQQRLMVGDFAEVQIQKDLQPGKHNCSITERRPRLSVSLFIYQVWTKTLCKTSSVHITAFNPPLFPSLMFVRQNERCHSCKQQRSSCIYYVYGSDNDFVKTLSNGALFIKFQVQIFYCVLEENCFMETHWALTTAALCRLRTEFHHLIVRLPALQGTFPCLSSSQNQIHMHSQARGAY